MTERWIYRESGQRVRLRSSQVAYAARVLAAAFHEDPVYKHLLADRLERARLLPLFFRRFLTVADGVADVWCSGEPIKGVAIWVAPDQQEECTRRMEIARERHLPAILGRDAATRLTRFLTWLDDLHKDQICEPHWYLMLLGVDPAWQKQGIGTGLVRPVLDRADRERLCCYSETQHPANPAFYKMLGFDSAIDGAVDRNTGLSVWILKRKPMRIGNHDALQ